MIKPLLRTKEDQNIPKPKKSSSFVPLASAAIGAFFYFQALVYLGNVHEILFTNIDTDVVHFFLFSPGLLFLFIFYEIFPWIKFNLTDYQLDLLMVYGISSIIPGIIGLIFGFKNKSAKIIAIMLFILYILFSVFTGMIAGTFH